MLPTPFVAYDGRFRQFSLFHFYVYDIRVPSIYVFHSDSSLRVVRTLEDPETGPPSQAYPPELGGVHVPTSGAHLERIVFEDFFLRHVPHSLDRIEAKRQPFLSRGRPLVDEGSYLRPRHGPNHLGTKGTQQIPARVQSQHVTHLYPYTRDIALQT